ncbi:MAG: hypothetical protein LBJ93_02605, partial [Clostridiales bacterium]|nr:hypothetical protein [Clostridiales bacterium]
IPKEFVDRQEEILKYELDRALYCCYLSTQRKISISYFFIALGALGISAATALAILSSQKVMELSLKSAAFLAPTIISVVVLLIAAIIVFVLQRSQPRLSKPVALRF